MNRIKLFIILLSCYQALADTETNNIIGSSGRKISTGDQLVSSVIDNCFDGELSVMKCIRLNALNYLDTIVGITEDKRSRSLEEEEENYGKIDDNKLDRMILNRIKRYLKNKEFKVQLPEFFFQEATLTFTPSKGFSDFDVSFPPPSQNEARAHTKARDMMKDKMLLPLLMLVKLKLKALTPIMMALIGLKALKALVLSKIAILLVVGFLVVQLCKKAGMMMPMLPSVEAVTPAPSYGPAPVAASSYEPSAWEPSQGGPYSRVWDAQQLAYNAYAGNQDSQQMVQTNI